MESSPLEEQLAAVAAMEPQQAVGAYEAIIYSADSSEEALKVKEQAIMALGELYAKLNQGDKLGQLLTALRPFFATVPKAKTAKIVRMLIDQAAKISDSHALQMNLCKEVIEWCVAEKRSFLRQRVQSRLASLLYEAKQYTDALKLLEDLLREVKRLDDKPLLVEINLIESQVHFAVRNLAKSKASLTSARTAANAIYCPPLLQAQIDLAAGTLHAEEKDFKTAFSYFYESYENFESIAHKDAVDLFKYMLLCKIMLSAPDDVNALLSSKGGIRHAGPGLEAMRAVATAHRERSLHDFEAVLAQHASELKADPIVSSHLASLYDILLQENICRIIEPYSTVETSHIAQLMKLPLPKIEEKLSQMILDKKFHGTLDAGAGCLIVYEDQQADTTYEQALETLTNMGRVVDALYLKAGKLAAPTPAAAATTPAPAVKA